MTHQTLKDELEPQESSPDALTDTEKPRTAQELFQAITRSGLIGMWKDRTDITDSSEFARQLRERAQRRRWE